MSVARRLLDPALALLALLAIGTSVWVLHAARAGVSIEAISVGDIPVTVFRPVSAGGPEPVVVIAHGFAGSQQLMQPFAITSARNGYIAVTFDFPGHGRNPHPLTGSITREDGATRTLVEATERVADFARGLGDGRLALLGHSMASDIVVRVAEARPDVLATIAVSMFSPAVTPTRPRDLLVIAGDWEGMLKAEALRTVGQAGAGAAAQQGVTYGTMSDGSARRAAFSPHVEHIGVLYSRASMDEALAWLDAAFGIARPSEQRVLDDRGPWILLLIVGIVVLGKPLSALLPAVSQVPAGAGLGWRRLWPVLLVPAIATPLLLRVLPTHFLPVLVGDYLAAHFLTYGLISAALLAWLARGGAPRQPVSGLALAAAAGAVTLYGLGSLGWAIDTYVTSFVPGPGRSTLIVAMLAGTLMFFLSDEWLTRGVGAARGAYAVSKIAFLLSLALAVGLDFQRLLFLVIIVPVILVFFVIYGLFSRWTYRRTGHPFVAGLANAMVFAWTIGVTFPLLAG